MYRVVYNSQKYNIVACSIVWTFDGTIRTSTFTLSVLEGTPYKVFKDLVDTEARSLLPQSITNYQTVFEDNWDDW